MAKGMLFFLQRPEPGFERLDVRPSLPLFQVTGGDIAPDRHRADDGAARVPHYAETEIDVELAASFLWSARVGSARRPCRVCPAASARA